MVKGWGDTSSIKLNLLTPAIQYRASRTVEGSQAHGGIIMERPRGVNCIKTGGGSALCTLHGGEGLYV